MSVYSLAKARVSAWTKMSRTGVKIKVSTKALKIIPEGITVETEERTEIIAADTVVLAVGSESYNPLQEVLESKGIPYRVVGDAQKVGLAFDAMHNGFAAGRNI